MDRSNRQWIILRHKTLSGSMGTLSQQNPIRGKRVAEIEIAPVQNRK